MVASSRSGSDAEDTISIKLSDLNQVHWELKLGWSSQTSGHSAILHHSAKEHSGFEQPHYSISHCPEAGGFACVPPPLQVGFDIEVQDRLCLEIIRRIASEDEILSAPNLADLWCAKEATFKSLLGPHQPAVLSKITVYNWQSESQSSLYFSWKAHGLGQPEGLGKIVHKDRLILGIALYRP